MSDTPLAQRRKRRDKRRERRKVRPNGPAHRILKFLAYHLLVPLFHIRTDNLEELNRQNGPLLLLANHSSVLDPFMVAIFVRRPVQYVISDSQIRSRFQSFVLGLVGVIPKTKVVADLDTVRRIVTVKREKGIIGLFPEGQTSWDGHSMPMVPATEKLVKSLKIPVFVAQLRGAYLTWPRWARRFRRGEVHIYFRRLFTPRELRAMSTAAIGERVRDALEFDAFEYQEEVRIDYTGARQAEYLERALFVCPSCRSLATLRSHRRRFGCTTCGYEVCYTSQGHFQPRIGALRFATVRDWNLWQLDVFAELLDAELAQADAQGRSARSEPLLIEPEVVLQQGYKTLPLKTIGTGRLEFQLDSIVFRPTSRRSRSREPITFSVLDIDGINVQNNEHLEFYWDNSLYRISTVDPRGNTYKWDAAVRHVQRYRRIPLTSVDESTVLDSGRPT